MVSVPVEVGGGLEEAGLELSDQLWEVSLDVCAELSVVVEGVELVLCEDGEEVSVQPAVLEVEVATLVVGVDSEATSVTAKEEVVSLWVEDALCEEVLVPVATPVVLLVGKGEVVVECWEDPSELVVTRLVVLAEVTVDDEPVGRRLVVLLRVPGGKLMYAPTTKSNRTITMPAENMT